MKINSQDLCHLLQNDEIEYYEALSNSLEKVKVYTDESHLWRQLKRCKECGQLFLFEFYEWIDWTNGDDPQYWTWIPVKNALEAEVLNEVDPLSLNVLFGLHRDWPSGVPQAPSYATLCHKPTEKNEKLLTTNCSAMDIFYAETEPKDKNNN